MIKYCIILQNKCVEERTAEKLKNDAGIAEGLVGGCLNPMWGSLIRLTGQSVVPAIVCSIALVCETVQFKEKDAGYNFNKRLLVHHV